METIKKVVKCNKCLSSFIENSQMKYCPCCGAKLRDALEEFRLAEKRARRDFLSERPVGHKHIADSCWYGCMAKYNWCGSNKPISEMYAELEELKKRASVALNVVLIACDLM